MERDGGSVMVPFMYRDLSNNLLPYIKDMNLNMMIPKINPKL